MTSHDDAAVIDWLLASDVSIQWQVMRDLLGKAESEWSPVRHRVETEGWGAELLSHQDADGQWAGGAFFPKNFPSSEAQTGGQPWTATAHCLDELYIFGLYPQSPSARRTTELVGRNSKWEHAGQSFWDGEVEECINGRTVAVGAYLGVNVAPIVERLLAQRMDDGGWNCERENGSVRSSFATTINVLEGLLEFELATGGTARTYAARKSGEEYLLKRHLFRRLTTNQPADDTFLQLVNPTHWRYDVLRALDYFRAAHQCNGSHPPDPRLKEAIDHLRSKRLDDGKWAVDWIEAGRTWLQLDDGPGKPSPWLTLRAMRVLKWWDEKRD